MFQRVVSFFVAACEPAVIIYIYIYNNSWIYKNDPVQKFTPPWFLTLCCYLNDPQLCVCLVIVVHESLVCSEQLNCLLFFRKILQVTEILCFSSIFVYLNPFQQWLYDFEIHLFTLRMTEGLIHNYYRRFRRSLMLQKKKHALRAEAWKLLNRMKIWSTFFLFCLNIICFHLVLPFRSYRRYLHVFQKTN